MARKDPGLAVVISVLLPPLGQVYNEQFFKALLFLVAFGVALVVFVPLVLVVYILAAWDAHRSAR